MSYPNQFGYDQSQMNMQFSQMNMMGGQGMDMQMNAFVAPQQEVKQEPKLELGKAAFKVSGTEFIPKNKMVNTIE